MANIMYAVIGERGEYSDWTTWIVAVYLTEDQAKAHVEAAVKWIADMPTDEGDDASYERRKAHAKANPFDERVRREGDFYSYYAPEYSVRPVLQVAHLDEYLEQDAADRLPNLPKNKED